MTSATQYSHNKLTEYDSYLAKLFNVKSLPSKTCDFYIGFSLTVSFYIKNVITTVLPCNFLVINIRVQLTEFSMINLPCCTVYFTKNVLKHRIKRI